MRQAKSLAIIMIAIVGLVLFQSTGVFAEAKYDGYEAIVHNLMGSTTAQTPTQSEDPFANVHFHVNVGAIASHVNLTSVTGLPSSVNLHGVEVDFGIDLFSPYWQAVGTVASFATDYEKQTQIEMRDFGMLVDHEIPIDPAISFVLGAGLTARYLTVAGHIPAGVNGSNTTPATQINTGFDFGITSGFSINLNASYEAALVHDTADAGSINGTVMLAGTF